MSKSKGARIESVKAGTPAAAAGLEAGDYVQSLNGEPATDHIAWLWESDGDQLELGVLKSSAAEGPLTDTSVHNIVLERDDLRQDWGIEFEDVVFDGIKPCHNDCVFCFMQQLPATARKSLCVRDDDYRLSFLQGNFITLTNLKDDDKNRIIEQRISPLRLSFHAADSKVRQKLIGKHHDRALKNFDELIAAGVDFHVQIVLVPGLNDGDVLEDTIAYLKDQKRLPHVLSVGIVPVAYTDYAPARLKELLTAATMVPAEREQWSKEVIDQVQRHQLAEFEERELTWIYLADEFYIHAHAPFPLPKFYDGFPQLENGIGMVLNFIADVRDNIEDLQNAISQLPPHPSTDSGVLTPADANKETVTIVCGELLTQTWLGILSGIQAGGKLRLLPVRNRYFGGNVSVTGLLSAADIARSIRQDYQHLIEDEHEGISQQLYLVPDCIFNDDGITLDDMNQQQLLDLIHCGDSSVVNANNHIQQAQHLQQPPNVQIYETGITDFIVRLDERAKNIADEN